MREYHNKYFKEEGITALKNRLKSLYKLASNTKEENFPINPMLLGFKRDIFETKEELIHRIKELQNILGYEDYEELIKDGN